MKSCTITFEIKFIEKRNINKHTARVQDILRKTALVSCPCNCETNKRSFFFFCKNKN